MGGEPCREGGGVAPLWSPSADSPRPCISLPYKLGPKFPGGGFLVAVNDQEQPPDAILLADPLVLVERQQLGELACVVIRLRWPDSEQPDMLLPLKLDTARLIASALVDCSRGSDVN
jgi:hypothetical protein